MANAGEAPPAVRFCPYCGQPMGSFFGNRVEGGAFYVGALGSRRAQEKRAEKLGDIANEVRGPVGLDLGGETPAEIALEIVGEILAAHKQR